MYSYFFVHCDERCDELGDRFTISHISLCLRTADKDICKIICNCLYNPQERLTTTKMPTVMPVMSSDVLGIRKENRDRILNLTIVSK